jgi:phosphatidylinositol glycan class O
LLQAILFLILNGGMTSIGLVEIFKDPATSGQHTLTNNHFPASYSPKMLISLSATAFATTMLPLSSLAWLIIRRARKVYMYSHSLWWAVTFGVPLAYFLLALHWFTLDLAASVVIVIPQMFKEFARLLCPRLVYSISLGLVGLTASLISTNSTKRGVSVPFGGLLVEAILIVFSGLSGTIILLLGRKGPTIALLAVLEVWCLLDLQGLGSLGPKCPDMDKVASERKLEVNGEVHSESHFAATVDWNLVAVQLFFCTGHRCTFDGLHYTAAFIGFDDFYFYRQGALLAADTFGASHILPVIGLPLLITGAAGMSRKMFSTSDTGYVSLEIAKAYISYGLVRAILATVTTACVALQRRHLMVWGLFAPKYVFDALGLLVIDIFVVIAVLFYFSLRPRT